MTKPTLLSWCALAVLPLACGESATHSDASSAGAAQGARSGGGGGGNVTAMSGGGGGASAGSTGMPNGGRAAEGGRATAGSTGGTLAGRGSGVAGSLALAGGSAAGASAGFDAGVGGAAGAMTGDAGAAGSPDFACEGTYDVCGCGCCGAPLSTGCYYPEHGDDLAAIQADDQASAAAPSCAQSGCASGERLVCCETPAEQAQVDYRWYFWSDDTGHVWLTRRGTDDRCTSLVLPYPGADGGSLDFDFPDQWPLADSSTRDGACDGMDRSPVRAAIGGLGFLKPTLECINAFVFDFTLFFLSDAGTVDAVRFAADGVPFQSNGGSVCP